mgnify:FL=1
MRYKVYTAVLAVLIVATGIAAIKGLSWQWIAGGCALMLAALTLLIHSVAKPLNAVQNGLYLLRDQDFSSRLRITGQPDADKIVELYNTLIESMKAERLKNLEQNRFLSLVVDASPLGIAVCDFDGNIVETNRAWNAMQSPALSQAIAGVANGETQTVRLADALIVRISRLWFMDLGFRRNFILVERLTDEIAAAEKQMFNKIVRTIGHEVNNTLGSVISVIESLGDMHQDDPFVAEVIAGSQESCTNLVSFVRGYADIVKLPPVTPEPVDLNQWLTRLHPTLAALGRGNVAVTFTPGEGEYTAMVDPMLMERVLINIVKNAVESIGERPDGKVEIATDRGVITVTDNGAGIADTVAGKLFTPFFSTKRPDRGLGLMLIADILRAHHARFSLATDTETCKTTFTIEL